MAKMANSPLTHHILESCSAVQSLIQLVNALPTRGSIDVRSVVPVHFHDDDEPHFHEWSEDAKSALAEVIWKTENIELTTVGIDIGSSTSHLMFARVHLQRKAQQLSSQFVVVRRDILWRSPILLTPFLADYTIDAERLRAFIDEAYRSAGLAPAQIDSGAVILTGLSAIGLAQAPQGQPPAAPLVNADHLIMQPEQAEAGGRVFGDASTPGIGASPAA